MEKKANIAEGNDLKARMQDLAHTCHSKRPGRDASVSGLIGEVGQTDLKAISFFSERSYQRSLR